MSVRRCTVFFLSVGLCVPIAPVSEVRASNGIQREAVEPEPKTTPTREGPRYEDNATSVSAARASLEVDTSKSGAQSPVLMRRIEELGDIELRRAEILPSRSKRDPVLKISVHELEGGGYVIRSHLTNIDGIIANSESEVRCTLCTEGETVERARIEVGRLVPFVRDQHRAQLAARRENKAKTPTTPAPETPSEAPRPRLSKLAKVGVGLLATGVLGVGTGVPLAIRQPKVKPEMPLETVQTQVPGYVLIGVGSALLLTGVALLVVGQKHHKQKQSLTVAPTLGGFVLSSRF